MCVLLWGGRSKEREGERGTPHNTAHTSPCCVNTPLHTSTHPVLELAERPLLLGFVSHDEQVLKERGLCCAGVEFHCFAALCVLEWLDTHPQNECVVEKCDEGEGRGRGVGLHEKKRKTESA